MPLRSSSGTPVIRLADVRKRFWPGPVDAVAGVTLEVHPGEILTLLGPSGCGKTTVLRLIAGFEVPEAGTVEVGGSSVAGNGSWVPPERRGVGMVFQDYGLFPHLTVGENVAFGLHDRPRPARHERAREVLDMVSLPHVLDRYPHELSGGQQQRVALARAIAPEPVVVLLDEPFSNLDAHLRDSLRDDLVAILRETGVTCIFVSHDQRDALAVSDRVAVMNLGAVEQVGTPREIYRHPESVFVATFVGRTNLLRGVISAPDGCVLTDFGSFCRVDRSGLPDGTDVMVAVRPEGFEASPEGTLQGQILSTSFTGSTVEAVVSASTAGGGERKLSVYLPPNQGFDSGDPVRLRLVSEFASVVRNACETLEHLPSSPPAPGAPSDTS